MQQEAKIEDSRSSPSFSCYSSHSLTSMAAAKVSNEEQAARFHEFHEFEGEDFEFLVLRDEEVSQEEIDSRSWTVFPVFNRDLLVKDGVDREIKAKNDETDVSASITGTLRKLFIDEHEESSSYSSSEADELESVPSGTYCVWRPKADGGSSPQITKCKKSNSTGSGSKRWRIRYLLRRSNSEGKEPMLFVTSKKIDSPKQKRNSGEVSRASHRLKSETPVHEQFYVQKRAENEIVKRRSYLPYRQDLVGLFANHNRMGKMLPF
ncbi:uncharacterized protein LOC112512605 [Cynara cardunculus var. scolymus]|uniref:Uncharacterized protein n=1 Tax=Cynara cardunculus var. scolymus TaxID=59895 RepID=A0A103Y4V9_CYNCS|nr:uncharacterized protein LOC112512605 [Cynara cardunculus var. scolymus]KVI02557.1 Protein of unknown function DUF1645 [Cynara cardunculus var. scolymus]